MIYVAFYDPTTGLITGIAQMAPVSLKSETRKWVEIPKADFSFKLDSSHKVVNGQLVEK